MMAYRLFGNNFNIAGKLFIYLIFMESQKACFSALFI